MSFSSYYPSSSGGLERGNGDDSGAGSEEGLELQEEPAAGKPARGSGSKRSRAAEVHNLSEKRRRSRINEKMKALQNLIPNSNKTDKASMLDEAIEYLKQLQLQVQMLSMRNGLNAHPMYLPGAMQQLQASQMCMGFEENTSVMNMGVVGMLPLNQDTSGHNSFNLSSHSHQPIILPTTVASISVSETSFGMESSQSRHGFQLRAPTERLYTEDLLPHQQLDSGHTTRNLPENEMKTMAAASSLHFIGQASTGVEQNEDLDDALPKDHPAENQIFMPRLDSLQTGTGMKDHDVKAGSYELSSDSL